MESSTNSHLINKYVQQIRFLFIQHKNSSSVARITFFKVAELDLLS